MAIETWRVMSDQLESFVCAQELQSETPPQHGMSEEPPKSLETQNVVRGMERRQHEAGGLDG